jgi:nucleoside-diphosphate-sugar epimerase
MADRSLYLYKSVNQSNQLQLNRIYNFCKNTVDPIECVFGAPIPDKSCFPESPYNLSGTLLVVGGLGYIGVNTINTIFSQFPNLNFVVLDNLSASNANPLNINQPIRDDSRYIFINGNMNDVSVVQGILDGTSTGLQPVTLILHLAAYLPWQDASNSQFIQNNVNSLNTFLETCAPYCETGQIQNILYQSSLLAIIESSFVFNSTNYTNTFPTPPNIYSTTKAAAAEIASYYNRIGNRMPITIMFPSHVFGGTNQNPNDALLYYQTQLQDGNKLLVSPYFNINYDNWISVVDVINAYILILLKGYDGSTYNLVNPSQTFTYLDTQVKIIRQLKPGQPVSDWLESTNQIGFLAVQAKGFIKPSNLPCFNPIITLDSEIKNMPIQS